MIIKPSSKESGVAFNPNWCFLERTIDCFVFVFLKKFEETDNQNLLKVIIWVKILINLWKNGRIFILIGN